MTTLTEQERNAVITACKYAMQDYGRVQSLPEPNIISKENKLMESALDKLSTAPKYDPCRKFREGDIVTPCSVKGRWLGADWKDRSGIRFTVTTDEDEDCTMWVKDPDSIQQDCVDVVYFQLVVPVEELEPYSVVDAHTHWDVANKDMKTVSTYSKGYHPHAKAAAEAECQRLNEEHRKEQA